MSSEKKMVIFFGALVVVAILATIIPQSIYPPIRVEKSADTKPLVAVAPVHHEIVKVTRGHWQHFGVLGGIYRSNTKPGVFEGIEGGLMFFKTLNGQVWFADFEPNDNRNPLDERQVYLVRISGELAKGCGYKMRDFTTAPTHCVVEEKILGWKEAKSFLQPKVSPDCAHRVTTKHWAESPNYSQEGGIKPWGSPQDVPAAFSFVC